MGDASVGSINHVLQTAFKEVYEDFKKKDEAKIAREARLERERAEIEEKLRLEAALADTESPAPKATLTQSQAPISVKKTQTSKKNELPSSTNDSKASTPTADKKISAFLPGLEKKQSISRVADIKTPPNADAIATLDNDELENYKTPIDLINLSETHNKLLNEQRSRIEIEQKTKIEQANQLINYLNVQKNNSKLIEIQEEEELKKRGIMIGKHIPSLTSKLDLKPDVLQDYGLVSSNFIVAKEIITQNKNNQLRRTGNMPISDLAETRKAERRSSRRSAEDDNQPNYLQITSQQKNRNNTTKIRFSTTFANNNNNTNNTSGIKMTNLLSSTTNDATNINLSNQIELQDKKKKKKIDFVFAEDREKEDEILESMQQKLRYLKNPRQDPTATSKILIKSKPNIQNTNKKNKLDDVAESSDNDDIDEYESNKQSIKKVMTTSMSIQEDDEILHNRLPPRSKPGALTPLFLSEPDTILFHSYSSGEVYTAPISFRNISSTSRYFRVIPPKTEYFKISPLKYPLNCNGGCVAPGMNVTATISFYPNTVGDFQDTILVTTEGGKYEVPLIAHRESPRLSIPPLLDIGSCLIGDAMRVLIPCTNTGGSGKFRVVASDDYSNLPPDFEWALGCLRMPPFTIYPIEFELNKNESIDLNIEFVPLSIGIHTTSFITLCDNLQSREFTITAISKQIEMYVSEINSGIVNMNDKEIIRDLYFSPCIIGGEHTQQLVVTNDTGLPVEFEWVWVEPRSRDLRKAGLAQIHDRQKEEAEYNKKMEQLTLPPPPRDSSGPFPGGAVAAAAGDNNGALVESYPAVDMLNETPRNVVSKRSLELYPARGVLSSNGVEVFKIAYKPEALSRVTNRAVLMLKNIPLCSLKELAIGHASLEKLAEHGHGAFIRLRSWIEELGVEVQPESDKHTSDIDHRIKVTSLSVILSMARDYASSEVSEEDMLKVMTLIKLVAKYMTALLQNETISINEDSTNATDSHITHQKSNASETPDDEESYGSSLSHNHSRRGGGGGGVGGILEKSSLKLSLVYWDSENETTEPMWVPPLKITAETIEENVLSLDNQLNISKEFQQLLSSIYVDSKHALSLLGPEISNILDSKVKHEAVEFIQSISRGHFPSINFEVSGESKPLIIAVTPTILNVGGVITIGDVWDGQVVIKNLSDVLTDVECYLKNMSISCLDPYAATSSEPTNKQCKVTVDQPHVILMPEAEETVKLSIVVSAIGKFQIRIPLRVEDRTALLQDILINVHVVAPRLRFESPEVDFGLVGVDQDEEKNLTVSNESNVGLKFLVHVTQEQDYESQLIGNFTRSPSGRQLSSRSVLSETSSVSEAPTPLSQSPSISSMKTSRHANSQIVISPVAAELAPGQSMTMVATCKAGRQPQRVRGVFEYRIFELDNLVSLPSQYLSFRGEVQSPKVILSPMFIDLGKVFVNTPVKFNFTLRNLSNLNSKYKFERPGGESNYFKITFSNSWGILGPKNSIDIQAEFVALTSGVTDDLIGCKIYGASIPLGFSLKAMARGVQLEFISLSPSEPLPPPLGKLTDTQYPGVGDVPDPAQIIPIDFGQNVELYGRRSRRIAIRNLSATTTEYHISAKRYTVPADLYSGNPDDPPRQDTDISATNIVKNIGTLVVNEDGANRFHSLAGKGHTGQALLCAEDQAYLTNRFGAAYYIHPIDGKLGPWEVKEITIRAYNEMPGNYDDELLIDVKDYRKVNIPLRMEVAGCPVIIEKDTVGMTSTLHSNHLKGNIIQQLLHMGYKSINSEPLVRQFRVRNNGSIPAKLKWKIRGVANKVHGPIKVELGFASPPGGQSKSTSSSTTSKHWLKLKSKLLFWDDIAKATPYTIIPDNITIPPFSKETFTVTLSRTSNIGLEHASLSGRVVFESTSNEEVDATLADGSSIDSASTIKTIRRQNMISGEHSSHGGHTLMLLVEGSIQPPTIQLNGKELIANRLPVTELKKDEGIRLTAQVTLLFAKENKRSDVCTKQITITNPSPVDLIFGVSVDGSFNIRTSTLNSNNKSNSRGGDDEYNHPVKQSRENSSQSLMKVAGGGGGGITSGSSLGMTCHLLPASSTTFSLTFTPRRDLRETVVKSAADSFQGTAIGSGGGKTSTVEESGKLILSFSTGQQLLIPITVKLTSPIISLSSPRHNFGICHVTKSCEGPILLGNPTDVAARWSVAHIAGGTGRAGKVSSIRVSGFIEEGPQEDDPSVFTVAPNAGIIDGPTVSVATTMACVKTSQLPVIQKSGITGKKSVGFNTTTVAPLASTIVPVHPDISENNDINYPMTITIKFNPKKNLRYCSRFRFSCEFGNFFDLVLEGEGTYDEHMHKPVQPIPR